jgi:diguanylate cyclase (GGDEF)-like protein/PAS domain S-box-containing protein
MAATGMFSAEDRRAPQDLTELALARVPQLSRDGVAIARCGCVEWANPALEALLRVEAGALVGTALTRIAAETADGAPLDLARLCTDDVTAVVCTLPSGAAVTVEAVPLDDRWVLTFRRADERMRADDDLRVSEERFRALAANAPIGVFHSDHGLRIDYVNPRFAEIWGDDAERLEGVTWLDRVHPDDRPRVIAGVTETLTGTESSFGFRLPRDDGDERLLEARLVPVARADRSIGFVGSIEDVTEARRREDELAWQATHDPLTGLANRSALGAAVHQALQDPARRGALVFFDLDDFKVVNDSLGHAAGDALLRIVADRIADRLRVGDMVARFGGDEFVVLCHDVDDVAGALRIANRLLRAIAEPVQVDGRTVRVTASAGVVRARRGSADDLIRDADVALYQAKAAGKSRVAVFDEQERHKALQHLEVVSDLKHELARERVDLHYQPLVSLSDGAVVGAEALLRYVHPTQGAVPPMEVVRIAEVSGCIVRLGDVVLAEACRQLAAWHDSGTPAPGYVAVNVAAAQLVDGDLVAAVHRALDTTGLAPGALCVELTESQLMADVDAATQVLGRLHDRGVRVAIDDFGTGYSSLSYLRRFPVDLVKLDRSFVADLGTDPAAAAIVTAVVTLAETLDMSVVAEGVETAEQLALVTELGCHLVQGYGVGRPGPADRFSMEVRWS